MTLKDNQDQAGDLVGCLVGNYLVKQRIGVGGMGEVYLAEHPRIGRRVAIKVIAREVASQALLADRFEAEARALTSIEHPNIVEVYDFGSLDDGRMYYVMELLEGRELRALLNERVRFSAEEALPYVRQICAALTAAHAQGVVHRDLKPENIFVLDRKQLTLKILDFGIAKLLGRNLGASSTHTGMVMGTPQFIAPEQAAGEPDRICPQTDLYSLGVILYYMLSGNLPFTDQAPGMLLARHIKDPPPPLRSREPRVSEPLARLVHYCLEKEPERRPRSATEVAEGFALAVAAERSTDRGMSPTGDAILDAAAKDTPAPSEPGSMAPVARPSDPSRSAVPAQAPPLSASWPAEKNAQTTAGISVGEVTGPPRPLAPSSRPGSNALRLGAVGLSIGLVGLAAFLLFLYEPDPGPRRVSPAPQSPDPGPQPSFITVQTEGSVGRCLFTIDGAEPAAARVPCRFGVQVGRRVLLEVQVPGLTPFERTLVVRGHQHFELQTRGKALVLKDAPETGLSADAGRETVDSGLHAKKPPRRRHPSSPAPGPPARHSDSPRPETPPPRPPARIGEGTMEVDL